MVTLAHPWLFSILLCAAISVKLWCLHYSLELPHGVEGSCYSSTLLLVNKNNPVFGTCISSSTAKWQASTPPAIIQQYAFIESWPEHMFVVLLALVGSCQEPVAAVVEELVVISLQVTRVPVAVRARTLLEVSLVRRSNISDATLAIAVKAQTVNASWRYPGLGDGLPRVQQGKPQWLPRSAAILLALSVGAEGLPIS